MSTINQNESVRALFNDKAPQWTAKYGDHGALAWRVTAFAEMLAMHTLPAANVLDFGGATGALGHELSLRHYRVTVCDIAESMIQEGRRSFGASIDWVVLDPAWRSLPFADGSFDAIVASSVLEYVADLDTVLSEWARVLRPRGSLLATVPEMSHPIRRVERFAAAIASASAFEPIARSHTRVGGYVRYLRLSKNRRPRSKWQSLAANFGFASVAVEPNGPLVLLAFLKA